MKTMNENRNRIVPAAVFWGGMLIYFLAVLPFLITHDGLFFYYGDYNVQQVPFLIFAHRAVRQGRLFWNPLVDLGGNMGGTFSFYLWGSPFFWLTIPFPEAWLPYMMPFLMALKCGTASVTAYAWIRTQTRTDRAAALGAYLYAFSGFQACNIVFQHFHDATAFFPLYLLCFDRFVEGRREGGSEGKGPGRGLYGFILMTALMSVINYYFFFGQVVFLVLYYTVRWGIRSVRAEGILSALAQVLQIAAAAAAGLLLAAFFLVQSVGGIMGNSRISEFLSGYDLVVYPDSTTPLAILKSLFMVPDLIARGTLFSSDYIRNGSLAFYLPCFAMAGVFAFRMIRRRNWKNTLLTVLAVMAFVPVLCSIFSALNENYYARWFYMPVLLCACMTAEVLEEKECSAFSKGAALSLACTGLFILMCFLPVYEGGEWSFTKICENRKLLNMEIMATLLCSAMLFVIILIKRKFNDLFPVFEKSTGTGRRDENTVSDEAVASDSLPKKGGDDSPVLSDELSQRDEKISPVLSDELSQRDEEISPVLSEELSQRDEEISPVLSEDLSQMDENGDSAGSEDNGSAGLDNPPQVEDKGSGLKGRKKPTFVPGLVCLLLTMACCVISTMAVVKNGSSLISYKGFEKWKLQMFSLRPSFEVEQQALGEDGGESAQEADRIPGIAPAADLPDILQGEDKTPKDHKEDEKRKKAKSDEDYLRLVEETKETGSILGDSGMDAWVPSPFSRVETDSTSTNYEMVWGIPTMHCFESTVHPSIFKWYRGIGMIRTVESTLPFQRIGARAIMSVRYYLENSLVNSDSSYTDEGGINGYSLINTENGYNVYETENYIPMGIVFDYYMTEDDYDQLENGEVSDRVLVKDLILSDEMAEKYGHLMTKDTELYTEKMPYPEFTQWCEQRAASACTEFVPDRNGFHATAEMENDNLVLFSVPYDKGFSATVDGEPAKVERADFGLTAVFVPQGTHEIRFTYLPHGFVPASAVSILTALVLIAGMIRRRLTRTRQISAG